MNPRFRKFISYYRPYRRLLFADLLCACLAALIVLALPLLARHLTGTVLASGAPDMLRQVFEVGALMLALIVAHALCSTVLDYQGHMMGTLMERDLREELFAHYQKLSFRFYDNHKTGQLMTRLTNDLVELSEFYHHGPEDVLLASIKFVGAFVILFSINAALAAPLLILLVLMIIYTLVLRQRLQRAEYASADRISDVNAQVEDSLGGIRVVQAYANERAERAKFAAASARFVDSRRAVYRADIWFYEPLGAFTLALPVLTIVLGAVMIANRALTLPDLLAFALYAAVLAEPIRGYLNVARLFQSGITGFNRVMEMLEIEPDIADAPRAAVLAQPRGRVEFRDVAFRYRDEHENVLEHLSLTIESGDYVAIVGPSGAGKTTLCALIPRFYDVVVGQVLIDGHDVRALTLASLRRHIGVVSQDVYLFNGTVAENIRYGRPDATFDEVVAAAKQANAHEFILSLPAGYDTDVGQRGVKLSGGQKQRISIARVFLKDPRVIIFDEATSSLDAESELAVQGSIERLGANRTMIVIAHRLSTVQNAKRIIVLTEDGIAEQGTHDALLARGGVYARLYGSMAHAEIQNPISEL
jgi:ATP-binding cassette, subfamily B, bacterial